MELSKLKKGQKAIVQSFKDQFIALKLMEMGLLPEEKIELKRIVPFGGPICLQLNSCELSLRKSEASTVLIKPID